MSETARRSITAVSVLVGAALLLFFILLVGVNISVAVTCGGFTRGGMTLQINDTNFVPQVHCYQY